MLMLAFFKIIMFSLTIKIINRIFVLIDLNFQPVYDFLDMFQIVFFAINYQRYYFVFIKKSLLKLFLLD